MTVAQMIEWLKTQDQEATVRVVCNKSESGWYAGIKESNEVFETNLSCYTDMRGNQFAVGMPYENDRTLLLGEMT